METINKPDMGPSRPANAGQGQNILSLKELIAEIDNETALPFDPGTKKEEIFPELAGPQTSLQNQYISLALEKTSFALPLSSALEIGRRPDITPLPNLPNWVLGISNIRGEIISFINLKVFFGISSTGGGATGVKNDVDTRTTVVSTPSPNNQPDTTGSRRS